MAKTEKSKKTEHAAAEPPTHEEQVADVLAKVAAYQTKKGLSDAAQRTADEATQRANTARAAWNTLVTENVDEPGRLVPALTELVDTAIEAAAKGVLAETARSEAAAAAVALNDAINAMTSHPPAVADE